MAEVKVTGATLEIRTAKLTRALLKQFRRIDSIPQSWRNTDNPDMFIKPEYVVGWMDASAYESQSNWGRFVILANGKGDYFVLGCWKCTFSGVFWNYAKQIYIVS